MVAAAMGWDTVAVDFLEAGAGVSALAIKVAVATPSRPAVAACPRTTLPAGLVAATRRAAGSAGSCPAAASAKAGAAAVATAEALAAGAVGYSPTAAAASK